MKTKIVIKHLVYEDGVIAIGLVRLVGVDRSGPHLAVRWLKPGSYRKAGKTIPLINHMGGATGWFIVPHSIAVGIARVLVEKKTAGLSGFNNVGFKKMVEWMVDLEYFSDAMCY